MKIKEWKMCLFFWIQTKGQMSQFSDQEILQTILKPVEPLRFGILYIIWGISENAGHCDKSKYRKLNIFSIVKHQVHCKIHESQRQCERPLMFTSNIVLQIFKQYCYVYSNNNPGIFTDFVKIIFPKILKYVMMINSFYYLIYRYVHRHVKNILQVRLAVSWKKSVYNCTIIDLCSSTYLLWGEVYLNILRQK